MCVCHNEKYHTFGSGTVVCLWFYPEWMIENVFHSMVYVSTEMLENYSCEYLDVPYVLRGAKAGADDNLKDTNNEYATCNNCQPNYPRLPFVSLTFSSCIFFFLSRFFCDLCLFAYNESLSMILYGQHTTTRTFYHGI